MTTEEKINRIYDILIEIHEKDGSAEVGMLARAYVDCYINARLALDSLLRNKNKERVFLEKALATKETAPDEIKKSIDDAIHGFYASPPIHKQ
jgi:hypothetical protein